MIFHIYVLVECNQISLKRKEKRAKLNIKEKLHIFKTPPSDNLIHTLHKETYYIHKSSNSK